MKTTSTLLIYIALLALLGGCTTMQTTYFRGSLQALEDVNDAGFYPYSGESKFRQVSDMSLAAKDMYNEGYGMIGYSQFVSPLFTSLAPGYATKYAETIRAEYAIMETPEPGASNLHGYLVTYWSRLRPEAFGLGVYSSNLPDEVLQQVGQDYNVVYLEGVVPGTPAAQAGLKADDVILAVNGQRTTTNSVFSDQIRRSYGRETVISVSRYGEHRSIVVTPTEPTVRSTVAGYRVEPWENTAPTDWSSLSAANTTARVLQQQQQQRELEAAYQRGRQEAYQASSYTSSNVSAAYDRYAVPCSGGDYRRGSSEHMRCGSPPKQWSNNMLGAIDQYQNLDFTKMKGDSLGMVFDNYPSIYGQLYSYPVD